MEIESEVLRQVALYSGVARERISGQTELRAELGMEPVVILMLLITLCESFGLDVFELQFDLGTVTVVDDLVALFAARAVPVAEVPYCCALH